MTKEQLKAYRDIKRELSELKALMRETERLDLDELRLLYVNKCNELTAALRKIEQAIETLEPTERTLMRLRYIEGRHWQDICLRIHYSWAQTHRIHAQALLNIKNL